MCHIVCRASISIDSESNVSIVEKVTNCRKQRAVNSVSRNNVLNCKWKQTLNTFHLASGMQGPYLTTDTIYSSQHFLIFVLGKMFLFRTDIVQWKVFMHLFLLNGVTVNISSILASNICILLVLEKGLLLKAHFLPEAPLFVIEYFPNEIMSTVKELLIFQHQIGVTV